MADKKFEQLLYKGESIFEVKPAENSSIIICPCDAFNRERDNEMRMAVPYNKKSDKLDKLGIRY